ncbi:MAG: hypothetical protein HY321_12100 [Armatimonadetes bacterium]|nr:hypothetical protein [Armatimonadota bacterium]
MTNALIATRLGWAACCAVLCASPGLGQDADTAPARLLDDALEAARGAPRGRSGSRPLVLLRIAETAQLHDLRDQAQAAIEDGRESGSHVVELCRLLVRQGRIAEAEELAATPQARYVVARTALERGDAAAAEATLRCPVLLEPDAPTEDRRNRNSGDPWRRASTTLALQMGHLDLARQLVGAIQTPVWKSGALAEIGVALARAGKPAEALQAVGESPDAYMVVIGLGRVAAALAERGMGEPLGPALDALRQAAPKVEDGAARDYALSAAVGRLSAAGRREAAVTLLDLIEGPVARVRAECMLVSPDRAGIVRREVERCSENEQPLLWELAALSCARHGMASGAADAAGRIASPWQRCRAQSDAARALADAGRAAEAAGLANAAAASAEAVEDAAWRVRAHLRVALDAERAGVAALADQQLALARKSLERVADPDARSGLVIGIAEALGALKRRTALREFASEVLKAGAATATEDRPGGRRPGGRGAGSATAIRERLVPALAAAGETEMAVAECERARMSERPLRSLIYRLAQRGAARGGDRALLAQARKLSETLSGAERAGALSDIALAQLPPMARPPVKERAVAVSLHGGWTSWLPRLERMGVPWDVMPFTAAFELRPAGLKAMYAAVGYPGAGDHVEQVSMAGVENLRDYLYEGGGFLGICAGQMLATRQKYSESELYYLRGQGPHEVQMRKSHLVGLGLPPVITINRMNGGILIPRPGCEVVGWYDKIERHAALTAQEYGYGRVGVFSPHPEGSSAFAPGDWLCVNALNWISGGLP